MGTSQSKMIVWQSEKFNIILNPSTLRDIKTVVSFIQIVIRTEDRRHHYISFFGLVWWCLLVEETGVPEENHWSVAGHWQTLSHNMLSLLSSVLMTIWIKETTVLISLSVDGFSIILNFSIIL
jgi:hypothetical protein